MKSVWLCILLFATVAPASSAEVAVIAHPSVPADQLDKSRLFDLYTGEVREWNNGSLVVLIDLKPKSEVKEAFYGYLGKSASRMKSIWMKNMLTGEGQPPVSVESQEAILERVASTPGAIGYIDRRLVTDRVVTLTFIAYEND